MGVRIEDDLGHARRGPRVDRLAQAKVVERRADRLGSDHLDRSRRLGRQDGGSFSGCDHRRGGAEIGRRVHVVLGCHVNGVRRCLLGVLCFRLIATAVPIVV